MAGGPGRRVGKARTPPPTCSSVGQVGSAELSMQGGNSPERNVLPAPAEGPPGEGEAPPHPEGGPSCPDHSPKRQRPQTQALRPALTGLLDCEGQTRVFLPLAGALGAEQPRSRTAPTSHQSIRGQPHVQPTIP